MRPAVALLRAYACAHPRHLDLATHPSALQDQLISSRRRALWSTHPRLCRRRPLRAVGCRQCHQIQRVQGPRAVGLRPARRVEPARRFQCQAVSGKFVRLPVGMRPAGAAQLERRPGVEASAQSTLWREPPRCGAAAVTTIGKLSAARRWQCEHDTGRVKWTYATSGAVKHSPALVNGRLLLRRLRGSHVLPQRGHRRAYMAHPDGGHFPTATAPAASTPHRQSGYSHVATSACRWQGVLVQPPTPARKRRGRPPLPGWASALRRSPTAGCSRPSH